MKTHLFALAVLAVASASQPVYAQTAASDESTLRALVVVGKRLLPQVEAVLEQQQQQIDSKCKLTDLTPDTVSVMTNVTFNLDGIPERGEWTTSYNALACKRPVRRTAGFKGGPKGPEVFAAAPGETKADAQLGRDVWSKFQVAALKAQPECKHMMLENTQIVSAPAGPMGSWDEAWIANVCGKQMGQIVRFYQTNRGVIFRMTMPNESKR